MENKQPDLTQPEIPAPQEKLLRAPTFSEKYGWVSKLIIVVLVVAIVNLGIYLLMNWGSNNNQSTIQPTIIIAPTQIPTNMPVVTTAVTITPAVSELPLPTIAQGEGTVCTMDAMICPNGTTVGRSGPNCEFVCPQQ